MYICYVDEAGDSASVPNSTAIVCPVLVLAGVIIRQVDLHPLTIDFLNIKERFFPALMAGCRPLGQILLEIKGSEVRRTIRTAKGRNETRHAVGFLDKVVGLLEAYNARIVARILVKKVGRAINENNLYTSYVQALSACFHRYLEANNSTGVMIADARFPHQDQAVAHSIFTQKFKRTGDDYSRILEMPTFGRSVNHAGIQIVDIIASGILFPIAVHTYTTGHIDNVHVSPKFDLIRKRFGNRIKALQFRYKDHETGGRMRGGVTVSDEINQRSSAFMFKSEVE